MAGIPKHTPERLLDLQYHQGLGWPMNFRYKYRTLISDCILAEWKNLPDKAVHRIAKYRHDGFISGNDFLYLNKILVRRVELAFLLEGQSGRLSLKNSRDYKAIIRHLKRIYNIT